MGGYYSGGSCEKISTEELSPIYYVLMIIIFVLLLLMVMAYVYYR